MNLFKRLTRRGTPFTVPQDKDAPWQSEAHGELTPIKRALLIVRPKQPYLNWVHKIRKSTDYSLAKSRLEDSLVYLIPPITWEDQEGMAWEDAGAKDFIEQYWRHFFAQSLALWELQADTWPAARTLVMFRHWFDVEVCDMVLDLGSYQE